jgi:hypothetical protein
LSSAAMRLLSVRTRHWVVKANAAAFDESPGGLQIQALPERCVTLSSHTATDVRPLP